MVDTSGFVALLDLRDANHLPAVELLRETRDLGLPFLTTVPTIHETHRRLLYSPAAAQAEIFLDAVLDGSITVIRTEPADDERAIALIRRYAAVNLTLTDAVTMAVMERMGVACVFSFDDDFFLAGFIRVPPLPL